MNKSATIKILWIDDQPAEEMVAAFASEDIEMIVCKNYPDGIKWLTAYGSICDAVILDVNCKETDCHEEVPSMKVFGQYRVEIIKLCESRNDVIPYFIYTGGGYAGADSLNEFTIERKEWWKSIDKVYYAKPADFGKLINDIKEASQNRTLYKYKSKYADIFNSYIGKECESDIIDIIEGIENGNTTDSSIPHKCRNVIESICKFLQDNRIVLEKFKTNISEYSRDISKIYYIPNFVQRHFHSLSILANDGSHNYSMVKTSIEGNEAPYLNRALVFELFNLIIWCDKIQYDEKYRLLLQNIALYEGKEVIPEQDKDGYWHYEICSVVLNDNDVKSIKLEQVKLNENRFTKDKYPLFGNCKSVDKNHN